MSSRSKLEADLEKAERAMHREREGRENAESEANDLRLLVQRRSDELHQSQVKRSEAESELEAQKINAREMATEAAELAGQLVGFRQEVEEKRQAVVALRQEMKDSVGKLTAWCHQHWDEGAESGDVERLAEMFEINGPVSDWRATVILEVTVVLNEFEGSEEEARLEMEDVTRYELGDHSFSVGADVDGERVVEVRDIQAVTR